MPGIIVSQHGGEHVGLSSQCKNHSGGVVVATGVGVLNEEMSFGVQAPINMMRHINNAKPHIFLDIRHILFSLF
jgi:hypothetical protein